MKINNNKCPSDTFHIGVTVRVRDEYSTNHYCTNCGDNINHLL